MRATPTDAEKKLWSLLRRGKLDGYHFRQQIPIAAYIVDFCCLSAGLGVKADGGQHCDAHGKAYDQRRTAVLLEKGITIIRFSDYDILKSPDAVQATIYRDLVKLTAIGKLPEKPPP